MLTSLLGELTTATSGRKAPEAFEIHKGVRAKRDTAILGARVLFDARKKPHQYQYGSDRVHLFVGQSVSQSVSPEGHDRASFGVLLSLPWPHLSRELKIAL